MHGAQAGKLRAYVRANGETGLAGLIRLADRHSAEVLGELNRVAEASGENAGLRICATGLGPAGLAQW
jgi:hypothetical protein